MDNTAEDKLIFERSVAGRYGVEPVPAGVPEADRAGALAGVELRDDIPGFPEVSEPEVVRHFTGLSLKNFGVDSGFYPLGSCTMKYNPRVNEDVARLPGFAAIHPYQGDDLTQGALELIYDLERYLSEISGMEAISLQPAAGAHGELCGMLVLGAYFRQKGEQRHKVIIPDTAHGTNPSSCHLAGFNVVRVESGPGGILTADAVREVMDDDTAALMLTNPNTLGLFESNIKEIAKIVHDKGGFVYCDGANLNALMGIMKLGEMGVDLVQFNLHKTFSTPHGGGGPGSGPLGVTKELEPYLPVPRVEKRGEAYSLNASAESYPKSIGRLKAFYGNFLVMVRAYAYIRRMGPEGLRKVSETAILNANYIKEKLKGTFHLPYDKTCMHECVFTDKFQSDKGVTTMDIAKRLIDYGFHPPTVYFPLVVDGAIMIEPTETETPDTLDDFIEVMKRIAAEDAAILKGAPTKAATGRVDETRAARQPRLRWAP